MSVLLYKVMHLTGVIFLFLGLASALMPESAPHRKLGLKFHGVGLILLLVGGFGLIAKLKVGFAWWIWVKLALWFGFGAMPLIGKRGLMPVPLAWGLAILCGLIAIALRATQGAVGAIFATG